MDNITHSLLGAVLAKTRLGHASPFAPAALLLSGSSPLRMPYATLSPRPVTLR